jgi:hypothetical protein
MPHDPQLKKSWYSITDPVERATAKAEHEARMTLPIAVRRQVAVHDGGVVEFETDGVKGIMRGGSGFDHFFTAGNEASRRRAYLTALGPVRRVRDIYAYVDVDGGYLVIASPITLLAAIVYSPTWSAFEAAVDSVKGSKE